MPGRQLVFHGYQSTEWFVFWLFTVVLAGGLMMVLLNHERRLVSRRVGISLLALRLLVLAALSTTLLQPTMTWTIDRDLIPRIVVAIDLSMSMDTTDRHATRAEKFRWARALHMIGNAGIDDRLDDWEQAFARDHEPEWVDEVESPDPQRRRQLARMRRDNVDAVLAEMDRMSRKDIARRLLSETSSPLLDQLKNVAHVDLAVFAKTVEPADAESLARYFGDRPQSLGAEVSDLSQALDVSGTSRDSPLAAVVLLTDGRDTSSGNPVASARRLGQIAAPVYPIILGTDITPKDLAVGSIDCPQVVFKDDNVKMSATIGTGGFARRELTVILERDGEVSQTRTITPDGPEVNVDFELDAAEVGRRNYTLRVEPQPGETRDDNNQKPFAMNVVDDIVRVLVLDGAPRWEFRYLYTALERDERVEVSSVVFEQPYLGILNDTYFPRRLDIPRDADDLENSPFTEPDLVIVGDVRPSDLSEQALQLLEKYVADSGGTLVFVAGRRHLPQAYRSPLLKQLLPITEHRPVDLTGAGETGAPGQRGLRLQLTADGEREITLQFDADVLINRRIWSGLPGHPWAILGRAKRTASVLAVGIRPGRDQNLDNERNHGVIVHHHYGFGQVLWIGIDSTWRWRYRVGDKYHHRFWGQLGRWAAENKAAAGNEFVRFGPVSSDIEEGDVATIRAQWNQRFLSAHPDLKASAVLYRTGDEGGQERPFSTLELIPLEGRPLDFEGRAVGLPHGQYRVTLVMEGANAGAEPVETALFVHKVPTVELSDLSANRDLLNELADVSGGRVFDPHEKDEIADLFRQEAAIDSTRTETELWDHWAMVLVFFGLLTAEWVVRKLNGLP